MISDSVNTAPAYMGWGEHEFDETPVFMVQLPKDPETYRHEFYIDVVDEEPRLHHRMIDTEVGDAAFSHAFETGVGENGDDAEGELVLELLIRNRSYWLGFCNVEGETQGEVPVSEFINGEQETPSDGKFMQQIIHDSAFENIVEIAKILYVDSEENEE